MKFFLDSVGCRLNQAEIEGYACQLRRAGHTVVASLQAADVAILNTCAVTGQAVSDSRQKARRMGKDGRRQVILTGCWSTLAAAEAGALPGIVRLVPNPQKDALVDLFLREGEPGDSFDLESLPKDLGQVSRTVPGRRRRTRAFIKVQEGCNNRCTFCITALARGPARSRPLKGVLEDIRDALANGAQEIILSGVHLGFWGEDLEPRGRLPDLMRAVLEETGVPRLRLSSIEPWDLSDDFFELWNDERLCKHLHVPLQSGCAQTLRRMARRTTPQSFARMMETIRKAWPEMAVTTDVMVGFPGETANEFQDSLEFVKEMDFAGGHVFTYSERPGTAAAQMPDAVPHAVRKERNHCIRELLAQCAQAYRRRFLGTTRQVLWEDAQEIANGPEGKNGAAWYVEGLTDNYLRVRAPSAKPMWNEISSMRLETLEGDVVTGEIIEE